MVSLTALNTQLPSGTIGFSMLFTVPVTLLLFALCLFQSGTVGVVISKALFSIFLKSNEIYQRLSNLAILNAVEGIIWEAADLFNETRITVSHLLRMDATMLRVNQLVLELLTFKGTLRDRRPVELIVES